MRIIHDHGLVRVVSLGDPFANTYDICVENYDSDADIWVRITNFAICCSLSVSLCFYYRIIWIGCQPCGILTTGSAGVCGIYAA